MISSHGGWAEEGRGVKGFPLTPEGDRRFNISTHRAGSGEDLPRWDFVYTLGLVQGRSGMYVSTVRMC